MIRSMTGYGKADAILPAGRLTIEIKTVNGKGTDINLKTSLLPRDKELAVRQRIAEALQRGTIDLYATFEPNAADAAKKLNAEMATAYYRQVTDLRDRLGAPDSGDLLASVLRFPDIFEVRRELIDEASWPVVEQAIEEALAAVNAYREREGAALYADVACRIRTILALYDEVEAHEPERVAAIRERLLRNLEELRQKVDPVRFEQEMIYYLEKLDINEEKVRLRQHCRYFMDTIDSDPTPGKKLGFILQEMGREINTTGSKANHAPIQQLVVRMKDELEKAREQSLNIL